jgi:phosphoglycolate phosphatase-like HAD superfamily hydrolase
VTPSRALVLFDIDGTLLSRAGSHHKAALSDGIRRVTGLETNLDGIETSGMLDRDLIGAMMRTAGASEFKIRSALRSVMAECQRAYLQNCATDLRDRICTGIVEFVRLVHCHGAVLGVVSGNLSEIGWKKLELAGLREFFSIGAFAEHATTRSRLALLARRQAVRAGIVERAARISLIGDHTNDIAAAKANGFLSIAVATGLTPYEQLRAAAPDILVRDVSELRPEQVL